MSVPQADKRKSSGEAIGPYISINYKNVSCSRGFLIAHISVLDCVVKSFSLSVQVTLSGRDVDKGMSVRTSGAQINAIPSNEAEGSVLSLKQLVFHTFSLNAVHSSFSLIACLLDLNCLTLTFNESPTKNKGNPSVSTNPC